MLEDWRSGHCTSTGPSPPPGAGSSPPRWRGRPPGSLGRFDQITWEGSCLLSKLTNHCHVGSLCQGKECWSDRDLAEVAAGELGLHGVQHHPHVVRHSPLQPILLLLSVRSTEINDGGLQVARFDLSSFIIDLSFSESRHVLLWLQPRLSIVSVSWVFGPCFVSRAVWTGQDHH